MTHPIPYPGRQLPLVQQPRGAALQDRGRVHRHGQADVVGVVDDHLAASEATSRPGLAAGLYRALGRPEWADDARWGTHEGRKGRSEELGGLLEAEFAQWKVADLVPRMHENSVPCGEVAAVEDLHDDPQVRHNETLVEWDHPTAGRMRQARLAPRFSATQPEFRPSVHRLNEHAGEILAELGLDTGEIESLRRAGAVF